VSEEAILDGTLVVAGFNLINRVVSALHFETPGSGDFVLSAWFLRVFGYRFLCGSPLRSLVCNPALRVMNETRTDRGYRATLINSTQKWFERLGALDSDVLRRAPDLAREVIHKITHAPASVTHKDVADLKARGSSEDEIFNLILGTAATAGQLRLEASLRAMVSDLRTTPASRSKELSSQESESKESSYTLAKGRASSS
jgi:hypothetical protein